MKPDKVKTQSQKIVAIQQEELGPGVYDGLLADFYDRKKPYRGRKVPRYPTSDNAIGGLSSDDAGEHWADED